jgi:peptidoglycan/LPS O-acetylase OafA/YrhL
MIAAQLSSQRLKPLSGAWLLASISVIWGLLAWQSHGFSYFSGDQRSVYWIFWGMIEAAGWAFLIISYRRWRGKIWRPIGAFMEAGGQISFSFYLWHGLIIYLWEKTAGTVTWTGIWQLNFAIQAVLLGAITWMVARTSFTTIEQPFLALRGQYGGKNRKCL